ncbi:MAG: DUF885 domain-containing protein [Pseudomonadota bacterium]
MTPISLRNALITGAASLALLAGCGEQASAPETAAPAPAEAVDTNAAFDELLEQMTTEILSAFPNYATSLGISEELAGGRYKDRYPVPGIKGHMMVREMTKRFEDELMAFDVESLTPKRREYLDVLLAGTEANNEAYAIADEHGYYLAGGFSSPYVVTQIGGVHVDMPQFITAIHPLNERDDAVAYIARLNQFDEQFAGAVEILNANAEAGVVPPDYAISGAIGNASGFVAGPSDENILVSHLTDYLDTVEFENEDELVEGVKDAVARSVYPGYQGLVAALEALQPLATHDAGIWDIPGGGALYDAMVMINGENTLGGEGVHALGLAEVERIHGEMEVIFTELGMTEGSVGERLAAVAQLPGQTFPNTAEGREELLAYVRELSDEAEAVMDEYFLVTPTVGFEVRPVPEYAQEGAPGGYYNGPSEDGSRPGQYYINLRDTATQPRFSLPTLTYHEGVPGHHFQIALATEAKDTPLLVRTQGTSTGMAEGWALYSEMFAWEIGLYKDDQLGNLGRLRDELFRAVRLVVDSGMHAKQWTREEAIDYMVANAGMEPSGVAIEIERYSVWPGQALAYKTGMLKIQELRARAEETLGEDFDLPVFHYELLRDGGAPLEVLEKRLNRWIEAGGPAPDLD